MPTCRLGKLCKIKNCPLKHVSDEELEECLFYKQGFCYYGPKCARRHVKRLPEECPVEAILEPFNTAQSNKKTSLGQVNDNYKVTLCTHWLLDGICRFNERCVYAHGEEELNEGYQPNKEFLNDDDVYDPTRGKIGVKLELPFPKDSRCSYFILQSPDLRSLLISKRRGVWAVPTRIADEMNSAYRNSDNVVIYFSVRPLRGIYGVARMASPIPPSNNGSPLSAEFPVTWLRTIRISLRTVAQLKLGTSGMFVGRSSTDGRFDGKIGLDVLLTAYRKQVWDWTKEMDVAERGIRLIDSNGFIGEYFPSNGISAYYLHPDQLFAQDWVVRAGLAVNEKGVLITSKLPTHAQPELAALQNLGDFYTGTNTGFIACANTPMIEEMLSRGMIGLPPQFKEVAIHMNVPLFVFDNQANVMLGIFYATSPVGFNMDGNAFVRWGGYGPMGGSPLPVQFTFRMALDCPPVPVPIQDPELRNALGDAAKSMGAITLEQTKALANLFAKRTYIMYPHTAPAGPLRNRGNRNSNNNSNSAQGMQNQGGGNQGFNQKDGNFGSYKPPFKFVESVPIDIQGNTFDIKKRVLGNNASLIMQIVDEVGNKNNIKIRIRGIGSGFIEYQQQELQEPLHFNISAENEALLQAAVVRVKALVARVKQEMGQ
jgi:hypothetical protein